MKALFLARRFALAPAGLALLAASLGLVRAGQGVEGEPIVLEPAPRKDAAQVSLPRGEVPLLQVLKSLADATGRVVVWKASDPVDTKLVLPRAVESLALKSASEILEQAGYEARVESWKGKPAYHVERAPRKKGKIIRDSDKKDGTASEGAVPAGGRGTGAQIQFYAREEGTGRKFIVVFETDSREEAETAVSLLKAHQRAAKPAKKKD